MLYLATKQLFDSDCYSLADTVDRVDVYLAAALGFCLDLAGLADGRDLRNS